MELPLIFNIGSSSSSLVEFPYFRPMLMNALTHTRSSDVEKSLFKIEFYVSSKYGAAWLKEDDREFTLYDLLT